MTNTTPSSPKADIISEALVIIDDQHSELEQLRKEVRVLFLVTGLLLLCVIA